MGSLRKFYDFCRNDKVLPCLRQDTEVYLGISVNYLTKAKHNKPIRLIALIQTH